MRRILREKKNDGKLERPPWTLCACGANPAASRRADTARKSYVPIGLPRVRGA